MADPDRTQELIDRYLNGQSSADELAELNRALEADPIAAARLWAGAEIDSLLESHFQEAPRREQLEQALYRLSRPSLASSYTAWVVAASILLLLGGAAFWRLRPVVEPRYDVLAGQVLVEGLPTNRIVEGESIVVGGASPAVIRLADGSQAELDPESEVVVHDGDAATRQIVELRNGSGSFRVPKGDRGLRVETAIGTVTSTDTQFSIDFLHSHAEGDEGVRLIPTGIAALVVSVAAGIVQVDVQDQSFTLSSGESRVFAAAQNAEKEKLGAMQLPAGSLLGFEFNGKNMDLERTFPGIRSALLLTDQQKIQIVAAQRKTVQSEEVRAAGASIKGSPEAKAEEKEKAKQVVAAAQKQLLEKMATILTEDQKALVKKLNAAAAESQAAVAKTFREESKAAKSDKSKTAELQQKIREPLVAEFKARAAKFLSAEQLAALKKGIEDQKAAEERAKNDPKTQKVKKP
jgi:hypothetical protein